MIHVREDKSLCTNTILSYKASLTQPFNEVFIIDLGSWEFEELGRYILIKKHSNQQSVPQWDSNELLNFLERKNFLAHQQKSFVTYVYLKNLF